MLQFNPNFTGLTTGSTPPFTYRPSLGGSSSFLTDSLSSTSAIGNLSSQQRFQDFHQPFSNLYNTSYAQQRGSQPVLSFGEDSSSGLGAYRTSSTAGIGDHRPTTAGGGLPSFPLSQHTHSQHSPHTSHESLGSSRGPALSHSPEHLRTNFSQPGSIVNIHDFTHGSQLNATSRPMGRYEERVAVAQFPNTRNYFQVTSTDPDLTANPDPGLLPSSLNFQLGSDTKDEPGSGQS